MMGKLVPFMKFLEKEAGFRFDIDKFDSRLKLQKYVFIGKNFKLPVKYHYSIYIRGPYSPTLADDYYEITSTDLESEWDYRKDLGALS